MSKKEYKCQIWRIPLADRGKGLVTKGVNAFAEKGWKPIFFSATMDAHNTEHWYYTFERDITTTIEELPEDLI